jgi:hypothetical protein
MQWVSNGKGKVNLVSIFHLTGVAHNHFYLIQERCL